MSRAQTLHGDPVRLAQLETILENAAEEFGDITPLVFELYYSRNPQAKQLFAEHGYGKTGQLEHEMVDSALYCLMVWFERPSEIEIMMSDTVPHHEYLKIPLELFMGLQETVLDVIEKSIAEADREAKAVMAELRGHLLRVIKNSSDANGLQEAFKPDEAVNS